MRARRSWPRSSVPGGCDHEGVLSLALKSISLTGTRQTRGPATTPTTMTTRTAAPTVASRWRRKRRPVSRQSDGDGSAAESPATGATRRRSEEHTSELQSLAYLVCRLLLEKKKTDPTV